MTQESVQALIDAALGKQAAANAKMINDLQQQHTAEVAKLTMQLQKAEKHIAALTAQNLQLQQRLLAHDQLVKTQPAKRALHPTGSGSSSSSHPPEKTTAMEAINPDHTPAKSSLEERKSNESNTSYGSGMDMTTGELPTLNDSDVDLQECPEAAVFVQIHSQLERLDY